MSKIIKRYKRCPRHIYYKNTIEIQKVENLGGDLNFIQWVEFSTNKKDGRLIYGYNLVEGFEKATEEEWNEAILNAL
jgi:hypothetical protein